MQPACLHAVEHRCHNYTRCISHLAIYCTPTQKPTNITLGSVIFFITLKRLLAHHAVSITATVLLLAAVSCDSIGTAGDVTCPTAPHLSAPGKDTVVVSNVDELYKAFSQQRDGTTIAIKPGTYQLRATLGITASNVTVRGMSNTCNEVVLAGAGMDNPEIENGFWISARNTKIANLTIRDVYYHTVQIDQASVAPHLYNVALINSGQQFVKSNPTEFGNGVARGTVEYSTFKYTDGPSILDRSGSGTGYTNGLSIHAGIGWRISNNTFSNFHTPDNADFLSNAAVLVWNGARETVTENNTFINVDRAISYGLSEKGHDHRGGVIRNNMVYMAPGLYSEARSASADAPIIIWDSPNTKVLHNSVLTNGNTPNSIQLRFETSAVEVAYNLTDAPIRHRDGAYFTGNKNVVNAQPDWFVDPDAGNLRITTTSAKVRDRVRRHRLAVLDIDGQQRPNGSKVDIGADEAN